MRRGLIVSMLVLGAIPFASAGGIFYNSNQSAEYFRTFERNSATDNADIVYYNMAGTVKLKEGLSFNVSNQSIFQWATVQTKGNPVVGDRKYESSNPALFVPNLYMAYRKSDWCFFAGVEAIGATAIREWKEGLPTLDLFGKQMAGYGGIKSTLIGMDAGAAAYAAAITAGLTPEQAAAAGQRATVAGGLDASYFTSDSYLKGSSSYIALRFGAAHQFNPYFSMALAGRMVTSKQDIVGRVDSACTYNQNGHDLRGQTRAVIDTSDKATGFSGEVGINVYPSDKTVLSLTYEMATSLKFKTTVHGGKNGNGLFVDGKESHLDLPQVIRLGVGHQFTPALRASLGFNAYQESSVDFSMLDNPANNNDHTQDYRNTYEESLAIEYRTSKQWLWSVGINFNQIGQRKSSTIDTSVPGAHANYMSLGTGFQYEPSDRWKFNFGISHTRFISKYENADVMGDQALKSNFAAYGVSIDPRKEYDKRYIIVAFGLEYRFNW